MKSRQIILFFLYLLFAFLVLMSGEVDLLTSDGKVSSLSAQVLLQLRLPKLFMALAAGGGLALCGLLLQTFFQNPLAGPFVLGIQSGASFGVAMWMFLFSSLPWWPLALGSTAAAFIGSFAAMGLLIWLSHRMLHNVSLLIMGLLLNFFVSGALNILAVMNPAEKLKSFFVWSLGSFQRVGLQTASVFFFCTLVVLFLCFWLAPWLNKWLLGESYAESLGVSRKGMRWWVIVLSSLIVASVTSLCGPIAFVGLMAPHMTRLLFKTADHHILLFHSYIVGGLFCTLAVLISGHWTAYVLPVNSVLSLLGIPLFIAIFLLPQTRHLFFDKQEAS